MRRSDDRKETYRGKIISVVLAVTILLTACAGRTKESKVEADTPREAAEKVMRSIKELDFRTFNAYTDNYEGTSRNFMGIPVEKEYKVFHELLKPHIFESRHYKENYRFARKVVEELNWEIGSVQEEDGGRKARIKMTLTNRDMAEAVDRYTMQLVEDVVNDAEMGAASIIRNIFFSVNQCEEDLIRFIDETENTRTDKISVMAFKEDGVWKIKLTDEFINGFMGNFNDDVIDSDAEQDEAAGIWNIHIPAASFFYMTGLCKCIQYINI